MFVRRPRPERDRGLPPVRIGDLVGVPWGYAAADGVVVEVAGDFARVRVQVDPNEPADMVLVRTRLLERRPGRVARRDLIH